MIHFLKIIFGLLLVIASLWVGAWGQSLTQGGYYCEPALLTAAVVGLSGIALVMYGLFSISEK